MSFSVANSGPWVADAAIDDTRNLADGLRLLRLPGSLPQSELITALDYLDETAPALVAYPAQLAAAIDRAFAAFTEAGEAGPVVAAMMTMATEWHTGAPRGSGGFPGNIAAASDIAATNIAAPNITILRLPLPLRRAQNAVAFAGLVRQLALREIGYAITGIAFDNYDQAIGTRDTVAAVFLEAERIAADAGDDDVFIALAELRGAITRMIAGRAASLNPLVTYRTATTVNSLTLAWRMYQDADRDLEICDRVSARNPAFLPRTGRILAAGQ